MDHAPSIRARAFGTIPGEPSHTPQGTCTSVAPLRTCGIRTVTETRARPDFSRLPIYMRAPLAIFLSIIFALSSLAGDQPLRIPIHLDKPDRLQTASWPVTFGIPFKQGEQRSADELAIVDDKGATVPCQIVKTGDWADGSLRWALADFRAEFGHQYFLFQGKQAEATDDIKVLLSKTGITLETGGEIGRASCR